MWVPPEDRDPICLHHPTRKTVGYFGAVRLGDGQLIVRREEGKFNGQTFWDFLQQLELESRREGRKVVVISDNAKYHHALLHKEWRSAQAAFVLDYLPPYSPDLNPIERVWKQTRRACLHNQYFAKLEFVVEAVERQFRAWAAPNEILRKLCGIL